MNLLVELLQWRQGYGARQGAVREGHECDFAVLVQRFDLVNRPEAEGTGVVVYEVVMCHHSVYNTIDPKKCATNLSIDSGVRCCYYVRVRGSRTGTSTMKRSHLIIPLALFCLCVATSELSAKKSGSHKAGKRPAECETIDPCEFTSPPITVLRPNSSDTCTSAEPAEVWFKCRLTAEGKIETLKLLWCSSEDTSFIATAREVMHATSLSTAWPGKYARDRWLHHAVLFRTQQKDVCELNMSRPESTKPGDVTVLPEMTYEQRPAYPSLAIQRDLGGTVWIKSLVNVYGEVDEAVIALSSGEPLLDSSAQLAAYRCKFSPARKNQQPVPVWVTYRISFKISHN